MCHKWPTLKISTLSACITQSYFFKFILNLHIFSILCLFFFYWRGTWRSQYLKKQVLEKLTICVYLECEAGKQCWPGETTRLRWTESIHKESKHMAAQGTRVVLRTWLHYCIPMKWFLPWVAKFQSFSLALGVLKLLPCCRAGECTDSSVT